MISFQHHNKLHSGLRRREYKCSECQLTFTNLWNLAKHEKKKHDLETDLPFQCDKCKKQFILEEALNYHRKIEHECKIDLFECDSCHLKFFTKSSKYAHEILQHELSSSNLHFCSFCSEVCLTKREIIKHHQEIHTLLKLPFYLCDVCEFSSDKLLETKVNY